MNKRTILAALLLSASTAAFAADIDLVIPASGSAAGALGSRWQSEVTLFNAATSPMPLTLTYHDGSGLNGSFDLTLAPKTTTSIADIVNTRFNHSSSTGAIAIDIKDDSQVDKLVVSSRTFNLSATGEFGQDIPAVAPSSALVAGTTGVITGPSSASQVRLNFGLYAVDDTTIEWRLLRKDGTLAKTVQASYDAGTQVQYTRGVESFLGATPQDNDVILADIMSGRAILFGSAVNNTTGDPTYVPAGRTRETANVEFLGIDLDENGSVDIQAHNGTLDQPLVLHASAFPNNFRVVATQADARPLTFTLIDASRDASLVDSNGTIEWSPSPLLAGTSGVLTVRVSDGIHTADLLIPVLYR